jgi:F420-non-reducing hydrogenase iron-sulfur subunit
MESGRLHFSWISSAEASKFAETARGVVDVVKAAGPSQHFIKKHAEVL